MALKLEIKQGEELLFKVAAISAAVIGLATAWSFYKNNLWEPKIEVVDVDFQNAVAHLFINGRPFVLRGDSSYLIAYDWGIKFGHTYKEGTKVVYDRIEVLKRNNVKKVIKQAD